MIFNVFNITYCCVLLLIAMVEGGNKDAIDFIITLVDPNVLFKHMITLIKRLYLKTKYANKKDTEKWVNQLKKSGFIHEHKCDMLHYKPQLGIDLKANEGKNMTLALFKGLGSNVIDTTIVDIFGNVVEKHDATNQLKSQRDVTEKESVLESHKPTESKIELDTEKSKEEARSFSQPSVFKKENVLTYDPHINTEEKLRLKTAINQKPIEDDCYNIYLEEDKLLLEYINNDYQLDSFNDLLSHYINSEVFANHPCMELAMKIYALVRNLELSQKYKGFMLKKTDELKNFFWRVPNVRAMCTKEELDYFSEIKVHKHAAPEEIIGLCFITNVCHSVEIVNKNDDNCLAFYPM